MKKTFGFLILLFAGLMMSGGMTACSDDDDNNDIDVVITQKDLPGAAQNFISTYFATSEILKITKDIDHGVVLYDVDFTDGMEATFNSAGEWIEVDAPYGRSIPTGFIPATIRDYLNTNYQNFGVSDITRVAGGYEVELVSDIDLLFDAQGNFLRFDN